MHTLYTIYIILLAPWPKARRCACHMATGYETGAAGRPAQRGLLPAAPRERADQRDHAGEE